MAKKKPKLGIQRGGGASNVPNRLRPEIPFNAPLGSYDPALDAAERASGRGLQDLLDDRDRYQERADMQVQWGRDDITRNRDESLSDLDQRNSRFGRDLGTARQRGGEDYTTGKTRLGEDYQSSLANLARNYQRLGNSQRQSATAAGVQGGGALAQAARKRKDNEAWDRKPIDQGFQRGNQDMDRSWNRQQQDWNTSESDWGQDYQTNRGRITAGADRDLGRLNMSNWWDFQDRHAQATRAKRENTYFGQDTQEAKVAQVQQTAPGYLADWWKQNQQRGWRTF